MDVRISESRQNSLWVGDLPFECDENYVAGLFQMHIQDIINIKLIRDKNTQAPLGYGFVEFRTRDVAEYVLKNYENKPVPGIPGRIYKLNWSGSAGPTSGVGAGIGTTGIIGASLNSYKPSDNTFSIYVGDLDNACTDQLLESTMKAQFTSITSAKVVVDPQTGRSKGFGFVRFGNEDESKAAIATMQGVYILSRPIRLNAANKMSIGGSELYGGAGIPYTTPSQMPGYVGNVGGGAPFGAVEPSDDPTNSTIFIGGIDQNVTMEQIRTFGPLQSVKLPPGKMCAFVQFLYFQHANVAIQAMHGQELGSTRMRLAWGRKNIPQQQLGSNVSMGLGGYGMSNVMPMGYGGYIPPPPIFSLPSNMFPSAPAVDSNELPDTSYLTPHLMSTDQRNAHFVASQMGSMLAGFQPCHFAK